MANITEEKRAQMEQEICNLTSELTSPVSPIGDWKIAKYEEYKLVGEEAPYDINELHAARQVVRDKINELRKQLDA